MEFANSSLSQHLRRGAAFDKDSSHGVQIEGGSTGGQISAIGDDANISIALYGKGTGRVALGNSSSPVTMLGAQTFTADVTISTGIIVMHGSTAPYLGPIRSHSSNLTTPAFSTAQCEVDSTTFTLTGVNSSHMVVVNPVNLSTTILYSHAYVTSTANQIRMCFSKAPTTVAVGASTFSANVIVFRF